MEIQVFKNSEFHVRTINDNGEVWFVAKDIAEALGYKESTINNATSSLFQSVPAMWTGKKRIFVRSENGVEQEREMLCLSEQGVYFFLGRSDKKKALPYQMWIAGDVVPSIRKTGSYSVSGVNPALPSGALDGAKTIFEVAGIKDNQLALALDKIYRRHIGYSALEAGDVKLVAPSKRQLLTPTEIGEHFGLTARRVNEILAGAGFQRKTANGWEALPLGEPYAVMLDVGKSHSDGTPIRQLKWDSSILDVFEQLQCDD